MKFTLLGFIKNLIGESLSSPDSPVTIEFTSMKPWKNPSTGKWFLYFNGLNITDGEVSGHPRQIVYLEGPNSDYEFDAKYFDYYRNSNAGRLPLFIFDKEYPDEIDKLGFFKSTSTGNGEINSKTIREALKLAFPENWLERDKVFSAGLRDVYPIGDKTGDGETWSIMNFFDTKKEIHELLKKEWEKDGGPQDVIGWMVETFRNKSAFVQSLVDRQWQSIKNGIETEKIITSKLANKIGGNVIFFPPGSMMDRYDGIDAVINGKSFQIKPLKKIVKRNGQYVVSTYGMQNYSNKKADYIVYGNERGDYYVFPNSNYEVVNTSEVNHFEEPISDFQ